MLDELLKQLELSNKESKIYLANLELGSAVASSISKKAQINRGTTYDILRSLMQKGLVHQYFKKNKTYFSALEPRKLLRYAEQKAKTWQENQKRLEQYLPELNSIYRTSEEKPVIEYYEGKEGIISMHEDSLACKPDEILSYSGSHYLLQGLSDYMESYWKRRVNLGIHTRGIVPQTPELVKFFRARNKKELRKVQLIPLNKYHFINETDIYADKVAIMNLNPKNYAGVIIKNKDIANTQRAIFELAWAGAKALYKKEI